MITKGIVEEIFANQVKVRIPTFDKISDSNSSTHYEDLSVATICTLPNCSPNLQVGDVVFVGFEDNSRLNPVILGFLYNNSSSNCDISLNSLDIGISAVLSDDTSIGDVSSSNIRSLTNLHDNVQDFINRTSDSISALNEDIKENEENLSKKIAKLSDSHLKINGDSSIIDTVDRLIGSKNNNGDSTVFGKIRQTTTKLNGIREKIGSINGGESIMSIISDIQSRIKSLEEFNKLNYDTDILDIEVENQLSSLDTLITCIMYDSSCYKGTEKMTPVGILWHSTGANNPWLSRYVQPSKSDQKYSELIQLIGKNKHGNDWNNYPVDAGLNAWIGKLADGSVATAQTLPWNYRPWGCGSGNKGSCNSGWIQFEICEDNLSDGKYFEKVYKEACRLTAYLCKLYNIDPNGTVKLNGIDVPTILCHYDSYKLGLGSNHSDVYHWFPKFGKCKNYTMEDVRADVTTLLNKYTSYEDDVLNSEQTIGGIRTSKNAINFIKSKEGFIKYAIWDYAQYSIGYGSHCNKNEYPNGITEAQAEALLLNIVAKEIEPAIVRLESKRSKKFKQNEWDALVSFTYNLGTAWMSDRYSIYNYVMLNKSYTNEEFKECMCAWSNAGDTQLQGLLTRRKEEADIYLKGVYS